VGGCGAAISQAMRDAGVTTPVRDFGIPQEFLTHAKRDKILQEIGLTGQGLARDVIELIAKQGDAITSESDTASGRPGGA
jgi:1-deoxy-D-xylulose-5-phosphate synthase